MRTICSLYCNYVLDQDLIHEILHLCKIVRNNKLPVLQYARTSNLEITTKKREWTEIGSQEIIGITIPQSFTLIYNYIFYLQGHQHIK